VFDGTRVIIGGLGQASSSSFYMFVYERDMADTTTTQQVLALDSNAPGNPEAVYGSMAYDGAKNVYMVGRDNNTGSHELYAVKWTRATSVLSRIKLGNLANGIPHVQVRHDSSGSHLIEFIYTDGTASPYSVKYGSLIAPDATATPVTTTSTTGGSAPTVLAGSSYTATLLAIDASAAVYAATPAVPAGTPQLNATFRMGVPTP
jgi:hypothetical protein